MTWRNPSIFPSHPSRATVLYLIDWMSGKGGDVGSNRRSLLIAENSWLLATMSRDSSSGAPRRSVGAQIHNIHHQMRELDNKQGIRRARKYLQRFPCSVDIGRNVSANEEHESRLDPACLIKRRQRSIKYADAEDRRLCARACKHQAAPGVEYRRSASAELSLAQRLTVFLDAHAPA